MQLLTKTVADATAVTSTDYGAYRRIGTGLVLDFDFQDLSAHAQLALFQIKLALGGEGIGEYDATMLRRRCPALTLDEAEDAMGQLERTGWIHQERGYCWIVNGLRYDGLNPRNPKHRTAVERHLATLPKLQMITEFRRHYAWWLAGEDGPADEVSDCQSDTNRLVSDSPVPVDNQNKSNTCIKTKTTTGAADAAVSEKVHESAGCTQGLDLETAVVRSTPPVEAPAPRHGAAKDGSTAGSVRARRPCSRPAAVDQGWAEFQLSYPPTTHGQDWGRALKHFRRLVNTGEAAPGELVSAARNYARLRAAARSDAPQYTKKAANFLGESAAWREHLDGARAVAALSHTCAESAATWDNVIDV